ncbi:hypothetical protein DM02DRAFT_630183 [Periconia macrospinosa]|uniref:Uncharacterized protein n=1 Tax=Periconia macrospinosa TaxID=97972 RepID=A0A2V1DK23_9PLEO|nr:hypothetical protein DM02DRAFT_630183 [Periconia macrospinosa]
MSTDIDDVPLKEMSKGGVLFFIAWLLRAYPQSQILAVTTLTAYTLLSELFLVFSGDMIRGNVNEIQKLFQYIENAEMWLSYTTRYTNAVVDPGLGRQSTPTRAAPGHADLHGEARTGPQEQQPPAGPVLDSGVHSRALRKIDAFRFFAAFSFALAALGVNISANTRAVANDLTAPFPQYFNIRRLLRTIPTFYNEKRGYDRVWRGTEGMDHYPISTMGYVFLGDRYLYTS